MDTNTTQTTNKTDGAPVQGSGQGTTPVPAAAAGQGSQGGYRGGSRFGGNRGPQRGPGGQGGSGGYRGGQGQGGRGRGPRTFADRPKPEFDQKIISIRRVTRVMAGGRRFSFSVALAIGDKKGSVGIGTGKANDTALAIGKALKSARKNMITVTLDKNASIPHDVEAKFTTSRVIIMPNKGRGLVAGSSVRDILNLGGIRDVNAKILSGSKNKLNNARAAMAALSKVAKKKIVADLPEEKRN